jgi:hypothetical protein
MKRREFIQNLGVVSTAILLPGCRFIDKILPCEYEVCKTAWTNLIAPEDAVGPFAYVHPDSNIPNVLIYGDSISIDYTEIVRIELEGKASVYRIFKNGHSSNEFINYMDQLKNTMFQPQLKKGWKFKWDLIHFNVGLHDLKYTLNGELNGEYDTEKGIQVTSPTQYERNLQEICEHLQNEYPNATLIFATTTPVPANSKGRIKGDARKYNHIAKKVLSRYPEILIDDLYSHTLPHHSDWSLKPGNVHYNEAGIMAQAKQVSRVIKENLP